MANGNVKNIKVFISYKKKTDGSQSIAPNLAERLRSHFEVFIDISAIQTGKKWAEVIYQNIHSSDVLIVLLEKETAESDWVQREVDVARGAHVSILPILMDTILIDNEEQIKKTFNRLALHDIQYFSQFSGTANDYNKLIRDIQRLSKETRDAQKTWMQMLDERWRVKPAPQNKSHAIYGLRTYPNCKIHLTTGDITEFDGIEAIVNTENDYMQMARIYESSTLSSVLRRKGALRSAGKILEDTLQAEVDVQIMKSKEFGNRPIPRAQVVVTHSGHPESELVQQGVRYILHAAAVQIDYIKKQVTPIKTSEGIQEIIFNALRKVREIDQKRGVISPKGTKSYKLEVQQAPDYQPIKSLSFPLFGTGQGGCAVIDMAPMMVRSFKSFLSNSRECKDLNLERIHFSVFSQSDIETVNNALAEEFEREI